MLLASLIEIDLPEPLVWALALIATFTLLGLLVLLGRAAKWAATEVGERLHDYFDQHLLVRKGLITEAHLRQVARWLVRLLHGLLVVILLGLYGAVVFSLMPNTRGYVDNTWLTIRQLLSTMTGSVLAYLPNLFVIVVTVVATHYLLKGIRLFFVAMARGRIRFKGFYEEWAMPTFVLLRFLIVAFALVIVFPYLPGSNTQAFQGVSIFLGVLITLSSGSAVANLISGIILTYMRPYRVGDRVTIAETAGTVVEKSLLITRVRTYQNVDVTLPNSLVLGQQIRNFSTACKNASVKLSTAVTIGYDTPWRQVHDLLRNAALATPGIEPEPEPIVLQTALNDWYVRYEVNAATREPERTEFILSDLHRNIQDHFNAAGVEIMSPSMLGIRDGNAIRIPDAYIRPGYRPPGFTVDVRPPATAANHPPSAPEVDNPAPKP